MSRLAFFICSLYACLVFTHTAISQETSLELIPSDTSNFSNFVQNHLTGGFSIGAKVGGNSYLYFSPFVGAKFKRFTTGFGFSLSQFIQNKPYIKEERVGIRLLNRFDIHRLFYLSAEYEGLTHNVVREGGYTKKWTNNFMVGLGTAIPITDDSKLTFEILYLIDYKPGNSPYGHRQSVGRLGLIF